MFPGDSVLKTGITLAICGTKTDLNDWSCISVIQLFHLQVSLELFSECHLCLEIYSCPFHSFAQRPHPTMTRLEKDPPKFFLIKKDYHLESLTKFFLSVHTYMREFNFSALLSPISYVDHLLDLQVSSKLTFWTHQEELLFLSMLLASYFFNSFLKTFFFLTAFLFSFRYKLNIFKEFITFPEVLFTHGIFTHVLHPQYPSHPSFGIWRLPPTTHTGNMHLLSWQYVWGFFLMTIIPTGEVFLLPIRSGSL